MTRERQARGAAGEAAAVGALEAAGYTVVERNYRCKAGELDVVACEDDVLCFIEVKAVRGEALGSPFERVTPHKQSQVRRAAAHYLQAKHDEPPVCRFDVVGVWMGPADVIERVEILRDAFEAPY